jgi:GPH family glycoside/pentoside/hexuronide:cation symporter/probable glucitol transport protein GutA
LISNRLGKKQTAVIGTIISGISAVGMFLTGYGAFAPIVVWSSIGAFTSGFAGIAQTSMLADCVEYGEWKTGNRAEGMVFSTNIFKTKLAAAIGGAIGAYTLALVGYKANAVQSEFTLDMIHAVFTIIPGILSFIALIPLKYYKLTEERYREILGELQSKRK